ncbi:MAG: ABC transporter substrate-binding protein [Desulfatiglandales bacterium]
MKKKSSVWETMFLLALCGILGTGAALAGDGEAGDAAQRPDGIVLAVEFNTHASCAHVARNKGWYEAEGIHIRAFDSYVTGMALAAGLARGDIDAAYICLIPALNAYANGGVPLKVVAGTHKNGYALVGDPTKTASPHDLQKEGIRIGCARQGSPTDAILEKVIETFHLDRSRVMNNVRRMNPPAQLLALKMGRLDGALLPEQYPGMAQEAGFRVLLRSQDLWPRMQGSVLVVSRKLIQASPEIVKRLVQVTEGSTRWINTHPQEASRIVADALNATGNRIYPAEAVALVAKETVSTKTVLDSLTQGIECSTAIAPEGVQESIDYMVQLGYISRRVEAREVLDLRWLNP